MILIFLDYLANLLVELPAHCECVCVFVCLFFLSLQFFAPSGELVQLCVCLCDQLVVCRLNCLIARQFTLCFCTVLGPTGLTVCPSPHLLAIVLVPLGIWRGSILRHRRKATENWSAWVRVIFLIAWHCTSFCARMKGGHPVWKCSAPWANVASGVLLEAHSKSNNFFCLKNYWAAKFCSIS